MMKLNGLSLVILALFVTSEASYEQYDQYGGELANDIAYSRSNDAKKDSLDILMPGVRPVEDINVFTMSHGDNPYNMDYFQHDTYFCTSVKLPQDQERYIVQYKPHAEMNTAHHMLMFGCEVAASPDRYWNCGDMGKGVCGSGSEKIIYAWGRNAPPLELPKDVAFPVGGKTKVNYLVLQVHYGHVDKFVQNDALTDKSGVTVVTTSEKPRHLAAIALLASGGGIFPHQQAWHLDVGCQYTGRPTLHPFAFRVHAHTLGTVISGYRVRNGKWTLIGKGDPQRPQAFYPVPNKEIDIQPGDTMAARCTYNSMKRDRITRIGATMKDEMCNFYTMYYYDSEGLNSVNPSDYCDAFAVDDALFKRMPADSDQPLPDSGGMKMEMKRSVLGSCQGNCGGSLAVKKGWPEGGAGDGQLPINAGQITGVDIDTNGDVVIFHRAYRTWGANSFDEQNRFTEAGLGAITEDTVLWLNHETGKILRTWGSGKFYMPHGLTIDTQGNLWLTDVAMHQVFKFPPGGADKPLLQLGKKFQPGDALDQFCKPTDVAIDSDGSFFVSDGYCNSRILKFSPQGNRIMVIGNSALQGLQPPFFRIPHSVSLDQLSRRLFVADRENGRVLVFNAVNGAVLDVLEGFGGRVFAVHHHPGQGKGVLHVVNGENWPGVTPVQGYSVNLDTRAVQTWRPAEGFHLPHDVSADISGAVYVTEIQPNRVWKFVLQ